MIPLSILRVLVLLFSISAFLAFGDQLVLQLGLPQKVSFVISGLMGGLMVFGLAYQAGRVLSFCAKNVIQDDDREYRLRMAMGQVGPSKDGRWTAMASLDIEIIVLDTPKFIAFSVRCGDGHRIFLSTKMIDALSDIALRGLLAHECGHILNQHPFRQAMVLGIVASVKMAFGIPIGAAVVLLLAYLYMLRTWEFAADAGAISLSAGDALVRALEEYRGEEVESDPGVFMGFFYGHPSFQRRLGALRRALAASRS